MTSRGLWPPGLDLGQGDMPVECASASFSMCLPPFPLVFPGSPLPFSFRSSQTILLPVPSPLTQGLTIDVIISTLALDETPSGVF